MMMRQWTCSLQIFSRISTKKVAPRRWYREGASRIFNAYLQWHVPRKVESRRWYDHEVMDVFTTYFQRNLAKRLRPEGVINVRRIAFTMPICNEMCQWKVGPRRWYDDQGMDVFTANFQQNLHEKVAPQRWYQDGASSVVNAYWQWNVPKGWTQEVV